ncbi:OmpA family protein [Amaricoccus sp.]|uniref:OmpA family protein n=1 Tax=Amaricoccus sp. TaxID=1872485 RepID=UPI001B7A6882|nr:OmpA family protein [Amaricoccus sp.]MBP7003357.1 OmpA family protein [Amaricoccus sp.]
MRGTGILTAGVLALALAACARQPIDTGQGYSGAGAGAGAGAGGIGSGTIGTGGLGGGGVLPGTSIGDTVWFTVDQTTLSAQAMGILDQQIGWLLANPGAIEIEGHADERGTDQYNIQLGARRAAAVRDYMVSRGVPDGRISTNTFGRARPIATCADESCWSQNRRAVTVVAGGAGV